jgi:hypothetical protein
MVKVLPADLLVVKSSGGDEVLERLLGLLPASGLETTVRVDDEEVGGEDLDHEAGRRPRSLSKTSSPPLDGPERPTLERKVPFCFELITENAKSGGVSSMTGIKRCRRECKGC